MSFLFGLAPWQWAVLAAVPAGIVLLYFLKLKRQPVAVPSTFLWAKTIEDLHVNSLLQRLRTTPLLLLQLLAVALAALALIRPGFRDQAMSDTKRIFLLDASASMQASDVEADASRFEQAKRLIGVEIDAMSDRDVAMLMLVSDRADVLQSFTSDRRKLRESLSLAAVTNRSIAIQSAFRAADGLSKQHHREASTDDESEKKAQQIKTELVLYSDGRFPPLTDVDTSNLSPRYVRVGSDVPTNLAMVAFSAQRNERSPGFVEAFATVANLGTQKASSAVSLRMDGELIDADNVSLEPGEEAGLTFQLDDRNLVRLAVSIDERDDLAIDNQAFATLAPARTVSVLLITSGNEPLELALSTGQAEKLCVLEVVETAYLRSDAYKARAMAGADELIIFDRCQPESMPMTNTFFLGAIPPQGWKASELSQQVLLVDIDRSHPIMRYLDLFSLLIAEGRTLSPPTGSTDLLIAESGPVLSLAPREGFEDLVLGFDILSSTAEGGTAFNTDWQVQRSWPVFVFNLTRYLTGAADLSGRGSHRPGATMVISTDRRQGDVSIRSPAGTVELVRPDVSGRMTCMAKDDLGIYEVKDEKRIVDLFSVNLFDRLESTLASAESVQFGYGVVENEVVNSPSRREYWRLLLIAMLGVLSLEWWYYGRRLS